MKRQHSQVIGIFEKRLWQSKDRRTLIVAFRVLENDKNNPVNVNLYNSISITIKDNLFEELKIQAYDKTYEITIYKNDSSKYSDSYLINYDYPLKIVQSEITSNESLNYINRVIKLPIFKDVENIKTNILIKELGENVFQRIYDSKKMFGPDFGIEEEKWNQFVKIVKDNYQYIVDMTHLFKINVSYSGCKLILNKFGSLKSFLNEYFDSLYDFYFDIDEDEKIKLSDIDKIVKEYNPTSLFQKNSTYLYSILEDYFFNSGNTRIKKEDCYKILLEYSKEENLVTNIDHFYDAINLLLEKRLLVELEYNDGSYYTTRDTIYMEEYILKRLANLKKKEKSKANIIFSIPSKFDDNQAKAIKAALTKDLVLITGNPGTGKTLITNEIIDQLLDNYHEEDVAILTPTGRATININANQERKRAQTIHSFLWWDQDTNRYFVNENAPSDVSILIIDEFSMVPLGLFYKLLKGISKYTLEKIILVGDKDQLPAIGSCYLIKDFIENDIFDTILLKKIYRQAGNYEIVNDALKINDGLFPEFSSKNSQFYPTKRKDLKYKIIDKIEELLAKGYDKKEIAVLSPMYKHETGIDELNEVLSTYFREKEKPELATYRDRILALNDKIINLNNDSKLKVFNGEIGYISKFIYSTDSKKEKKLTHVTVDFDGSDNKSVTYSRNSFLENTYPAYCTSVHKYQGSECKAVIVVLFSEAKRLISKKLIYTAITRAKEYSVIVGEKEALEFGINNDNDSNRITNIRYLWQKKYNK